MTITLFTQHYCGRCKKAGHLLTGTSMGGEEWAECLLCGHMTTREAANQADGMIKRLAWQLKIDRRKLELTVPAPLCDPAFD